MDHFLQFFSQYGTELLYKTWEHLYISLISVGLGILIAVPLGIALTRVPKVANFVMGLLGIIQTVPSFAILAFFIPLLGVGKVPAIVALFFYAVLPILRNTYTGVKGVNKRFARSRSRDGYDWMGTSPFSGNSTSYSSHYGWNTINNRLPNRMGNISLLYWCGRIRGLYFQRYDPLSNRIYLGWGHSSYTLSIIS